MATEIQDAQVENLSMIRDELFHIMPVYEMIRDCLAGEHAIKAKRLDYLPMPNAVDQSKENLLRYEQYLVRAVFYNVTRRTSNGLVGQIFLREPVIELPEELKPMIADANGETLSLAQLAKQTCGYVVPYGRGGLLSDYPSRQVATSRQEVLDGAIKPTIRFFAPWDIINWKLKIVNSVRRLSMLVLQELYDEEIDEFKSETRIRYRVYTMNNDACLLRIYLKDSNSKLALVETKFITDAKGQPLKEIPFDFVGSENNDSDIDYPPMYDMAVLNISHYRNSADYEESCFITGQPTPVFSGLTKDWVDNYFKDGIHLGSRASVPLPQGAEAGLLQAEANQLVHEAMEQKHKQMVALGARLVEQRRVERTATEAEIDSASESSVLTDIARNVEKAIVMALTRCARFVGGDESQIKFTLNKNFDLTSLMAEEIRFMIELYKESGIAFTEFREVLRRSGIATLPDDEARSEIEKDLPFKRKVAPIEQGAQNGSKQPSNNQ